MIGIPATEDDGPVAFAEPAVRLLAQITAAGYTVEEFIERLRRHPLADPDELPLWAGASLDADRDRYRGRHRA
ncbi:hypothetical protein [Nocardia terpenica]|uniref:Uncharacterized protein n=1 Tax=Nocardia terpenica TaxID=455432 RepID=A0A291RZ09_9NOCA|nr:hypothetical protein [Nocardia terpenica]ATL72512.1 hypothetical protein CRH09_39765 [Nocardia terpenica]